MEREIFEKHKGKHIKITLKPKEFALDGYIDAVFETCIEFRTTQKTSYFEFDCIASLVPLE